VIAESSRVSGRVITFSASRPNEVFKISLEKATVWDALVLLSKHGTVRVDGEDFEKLQSLRRILLYDEKVSYCVKDTPVSTVINELSALTGLPLRVTEGNPMAKVNVCLRPDATFRDIISEVSKQTGVKIVDGAGGR
jgi:hypothetical protein